ncbi:hypothetical protein PR003_g16928 [Phytophthora rubi]|uniref:Polyprotein n=1 Tax=Phytophthora rubi TaxID=129364 RepID=A0A6A4ECK9_9STRA|nr:hypothetical protein PR001_g25113 [Phytophthora rubi]KAE9323666.1 hypothetical protein PR003_g16928 [Phytophthora rubi]
MRMTLTREGLLAHLQMEKNSLEITEAWLLNYMKAFGLIAKGVTVENHTKIRSATSAIIMAWNTLRDFYNRTTMHNRVSMTRRLHEFKMESTLTMVKHLYNFKELIVGLQTFEKPLDEPHQLVILLSSQSTYELISNIVEKSKDDTLVEVMEKLFKQHKRPEKTEGTERALKAATNDGEFKNVKSFKGGKGYKGNGSRTNDGFRGKCFNCDQVDHMKRMSEHECEQQRGRGFRRSEEYVTWVAD